MMGSKATSRRHSWTRRLVAIALALPITAAVLMIAPEQASAARNRCGANYYAYDSAPLMDGHGHSAGVLHVYVTPSKTSWCTTVTHPSWLYGKPAYTYVNITDFWQHRGLVTDAGMYSYYAGAIYTYHYSLFVFSGEIRYNNTTYSARIYSQHFR